MFRLKRRITDRQLALWRLEIRIQNGMENVPEYSDCFTFWEDVLIQ
jgi:hypothetical protein